MPLNLSPAFAGVPGIYVIGPSKTGKYWKIGMATGLRARLKDYAICFPKGYYIRMLVTLPPPEADWRDRNISRAVRVIEQRIHSELDAEERRHESGEKQALDIYRLTEVHSQSEWFHGDFRDIKAVIVRTLLHLGLKEQVRIHLDLASAKYGPVERGRQASQIPAGDSLDAFDTSPLLLEHILESRERDAVRAMFDLALQEPLDPALQGFRIPDTAADDRTYVVRAIKGRRVNDDGGVEYLVSWEDYGKEHDTWEPAEALGDAGQAIADWETREVDKRSRREAAHTLLRASTLVR